MEDRLFPSIKKSVEDFIYEEEGNITRSKVVAMGTMMLILSLLMYDEVFAAHRSHSSHGSHASHSSGRGAGIHGSHESHVSHSSHVSSSGHSSHGSHNNSHGSHSNHSNVATTSTTHSNDVTTSTTRSNDVTTAANAVQHATTTKAASSSNMPKVDLEKISDILTPNSNKIAPMEDVMNATISVPTEVQE